MSLWLLTNGPAATEWPRSNRDIEYIHILAGLWWARQLQNVIAIWSANACSGFSTMKEKCSFILPETVIHLMTLPNCRVRSQGLLGALVAQRRSKWQRQWATMRASQHYWGGSPEELVTWEVGCHCRQNLRYSCSKSALCGKHRHQVCTQLCEWATCTAPAGEPQGQAPKDDQSNTEGIRRVWCNPFTKW